MVWTSFALWGTNVPLLLSDHMGQTVHNFTLRILHFSDLHERGSREKELWRRRRVLGDPWLQQLDTLRQSGDFTLVCFTGDVADLGTSRGISAGNGLPSQHP